MNKTSPSNFLFGSKRAVSLADTLNEILLNHQDVYEVTDGG
ncbi:hypothetical protein [Paenibacillus polymyxa]|nr:hypothetical protein [Paenibacillus polymyxa]